MLKNLKSLFLFYLFLSSVSFAQEPEIDLELGDEINQVCAGCHGEFAEGGKEGEYPRLAGFPAEYIEQQIKLFKTEKRKNMPMRPYMKDKEMLDEDIPSIAAFLSQIKLITKMPDFDENTTSYEKLLIAKRVFNIPRVEGDLEIGEEMYVLDCQLCHGKYGKGKEDSETPPLAGQYTQYLALQIQNFISGERWHEYAEELFSELEAEEINDILAYLSVMDD